MHKLISGWRALRGHYWGSLAFDVALIALAFMLVDTWQTRNLPKDEYAPPLELSWLDDRRADSVLVPGEVGIIYFFAPWCFYCRNSIDNLDELVANRQLAWARTVALDYRDLDEVRAFVDVTGIDLPVLLGGPGTSADWRIRAFPTYFVIDGDGRVIGRSVGYSTKIGLLSRLWLSGH